MGSSPLPTLTQHLAPVRWKLTYTRAHTNKMKVFECAWNWVVSISTARGGGRLFVFLSLCLCRKDLSLCLSLGSVHKSRGSDLGVWRQRSDVKETRGCPSWLHVGDGEEGPFPSPNSRHFKWRLNTRRKSTEFAPELCLLRPSKPLVGSVRRGHQQSLSKQGDDDPAIRRTKRKAQLLLPGSPSKGGEVNISSNIQGPSRHLHCVKDVLER